jgi:hypothetical protein
MADVFAEVDEALRQDRLLAFWQKNGALIITFIVLTIALTGAISVYKSWDYSVRTSQTDEMLATLDAPDFPNNINENSFELRPGLKAIGLLTSAGALAEEGKKNDALKLYKQVSDDKSLPADFRELGTLMSTRLEYQATESNPQALTKKLLSIAENKNSPWQHLAYIDLAVLSAHRENNYEQARKYLKPVLDNKSLPGTLRTRAFALDHIYKVKTKNVTN